MAANYWASHASVSLVSKQLLANAHREDRARGLIEQQIQQVKVYFINQIWELARMCKLRHRVAATASVYFRRFYVRNSFGGASHDPRLVHVGCLYLASKTEETLLAAKHLIVYVKRMHPAWPYDLKHLLDSEMVIIQDLDFMLITYHPYQPLTDYARDAGLPMPVCQCAWAVLNDLYRSDIPLMYPPHILAIACIVYAWGLHTAGQPNSHADGSQLSEARSEQQQGSHMREDGLAKDKSCMSWLMQLNIKLDVVLEVVEELAAMLANPVPIITAEECRKLLDVANLPLGLTG